MNKKIIYTCPLSDERWPYKSHYDYGYIGPECPQCALDLTNFDVVAKQTYWHLVKLLKRFPSIDKIELIAVEEGITSKLLPAKTYYFRVNGKRGILQVLDDYREFDGKAWIQYQIQAGHERDDGKIQIEFLTTHDLGLVMQLTAQYFTNHNELLRGEVT